MSQQINDNFQLLAGLPIDDRIKKPTISERDAISSTRRFQGLQCFVEQTQTLYMLIGGIANTDWKGIAGADTSNDIETIIEGFYVLLAGKETPLDWEVGDKFRGWIGNRYVVGTILSLPVSLPSNIDNASKVELAIDSDNLYNISWGNINGVLSDQTDLQNALDDKANNNSTILTLNTFSDLFSYSGTAETVQVKDIYRGGFFDKYDGGDLVDDGIIFHGDSGSVKWKRRIQSSEILLQWWGVDGSGVEDNTVQVNNAVIYCGINGYKYLSVTGTIKITGRLNDYKNKVLFVGDGVFNNTYKGNYSEADISDSEVTFSGKINKEGDLNNTLQIIKADAGLKIVVFGDSIAYGRDYNTQNPQGSFYEIVNNETNENSWYGNFCRQLQKKFSDKNITSINRSIPGYAISAYTTVISSVPVGERPSWLDGTMTGKTWAEIMEDDAPDVIVIEHGMNSGTDFLDYAKLFVDLTKTWAKVPELVFMSTPTNNYINDGTTDWAGAARLSKIDVSNQQYILANYYNSYLIDAAKVANIKRYGSDYRNFTFKPRTIEGFSFINGASVISGGNLGIPANGQVTVNRHSHAPKYYLDFNIKPSSAFTNIRVFTGNAFLIFSPTNVTAYPYTTTGNILPAVTQPYTLPIGVFTNIKVEFGDFLNLYVNKELIVTSQLSSPVVNILDDIKIDIAGTTGVSEISEFKYYEAEFTKYKPTLTGAELWGELGFGDNGNAINHPTLLGVSETYNLAVNEFVNYLYEKQKTISSVQSIVGTANQVIVTPISGINTLSLPQSIATTSTPTFGGLTVPYTIFNNGTRAYSIEGNSSSVGMVDQVAGAFRWMVDPSGNFKVNNLYGTGDASVIADALGNLKRGDAAVPGVKRYKALISQTGTSAPTVTVLENSIGTITYGYTSAGAYTVNSSGLFASGKTFLFLNPAFGTGNYTAIKYNSDSLLDLKSLNGITPTDGILSQQSLLIEVYP